MEERDPRVEIREGESAAISCKARGKPLPTYSWIKASTREVNITFLTKIILYLINIMTTFLNINVYLQYAKIMQISFVLESGQYVPI